MKNKVAQSKKWTSHPFQLGALALFSFLLIGAHWTWSSQAQSDLMQISAKPVASIAAGVIQGRGDDDGDTDPVVGVKRDLASNSQ